MFVTDLRARRKSTGRPASPSAATAPPTHHEILFPKLFEDAWGSSGGTHLAGDNRSSMERARVFLLRFGNMNPDLGLREELKAIAVNPEHGTVPALAYAVMQRIFGGRHASFAATPLLQCVRFMLIKTHAVGQLAGDDLTRTVMDFFLDPTLERNLNPPPPDPVVYGYPSGRLKVAIVGGGPTALASAISLAEKGRGMVEVHMYERRWVWKHDQHGRPYVDYPPTARRRDQVVTLQESVTTLLSPASLEALFQGRPEKVWPGSANIQIRKVEDRFLKRCQHPEFSGLIHLHPEAMTRDELAKAGDFHVLLGADGAASWVRKNYFHGYENERGRSYALGLAFDRPAGLPWSQPLNVFLTLGQTRYLLNASDFDGRGYLNMQLTEDEWHKMTDIEGTPVTFGNPGCLRRPDGTIPDGFRESQVFAPSEDRGSSLWRSISDGLKLFGFKEDEVINVVRIPIVVQAVREGVQYLPPEDSRGVRRPHALVAVAGDAAMTVHFWPGRGLNSGIKSGIALGDEIVHALNTGRFVGLRLDAMKEYNEFLMKLQNREHDKRSIPILNQSGTPEMLGWLLSKADTVPDQVAIEWLVGAMAQIAARLEQRADWAFPAVANVEPQLRIVLRQMHAVTLREMAVSFPWPTREMGGAEVLPIRAMKPEEKQTWLLGLWNLVKDEIKETTKTAGARGRSRSPSASAAAGPMSTSRFEAPRGFTPSRMESTLRRSNAARVRAASPSEQTLMVPGAEVDLASRPRRRSMGGSLTVPGEEAEVSPMSSREPSPVRGDVGLVRLMSVKKPNKAVLSDAIQLALFRVDE